MRAKDGVDARKLIAKICDGGRVTSGDARTATGTDVVGFAVHPLRDEFWAIVDSADGALGIGEAGEWSPVALAANHLGTDAYWYRAYTPELALAVVFPRGGTWLRAYAGTADDIVARLDSDGVPVRTSPPPSAAGARALLATVAYEPGKYATGPDAKLAAKLHAVHDALVAGRANAWLPPWRRAATMPFRSRSASCVVQTAGSGPRACKHVRARCSPRHRACANRYSG